jgi:hypothetical protein
MNKNQKYASYSLSGVIVMVAPIAVAAILTHNISMAISAISGAIGGTGAWIVIWWKRI